MIRQPISVCLASYNGEKYIQEQINSILDQLQYEDELIIVDDFSTDKTYSIIESFSSQYIKYSQNKENCGYVKTFETALLKSKNRYICLSDQDDIWLPGRLDLLYKSIAIKKCDLVVSNFDIWNVCEKNVQFKKVSENESKNYFRNILKIFLGKSGYYGCTMMINRHLLTEILPFPKNVECHDLWIGMVANYNKSVYHLENNTLKYRIHSSNSSLKKRSLKKKIRSRYYLLQNILYLITKK